jgi:hypothetical protein
LLGLFVPERVQHGHGAVELLLRRGAAGNREVHVADLFGRLGAVLMLVLLLALLGAEGQRRAEHYDPKT